jgi:hypothetical protein
MIKKTRSLKKMMMATSHLELWVGMATNRRIPSLMELWESTPVGFLCKEKKVSKGEKL